MAVTLYDAYGRPIDRRALQREQAAPTSTGVRTPYSGGHPAAGLTPQRLAALLRHAIDGDPERYLELAEDMEERDLHYAGVLGIRKRQVAGLEITVEAASDAADDVAAADLVREIVTRPEFGDELIDVLDAVAKGFSATEILWDTSEGQWRPAALKWRDPRHFEFDRVTRETLLLRDPTGPQPLKPFGWLLHFAKAKSGLPIRGGLARPAAWGYLFKAFTGKDWAIFCEAFGQPLRLGKYGAGASEADKETLLRAVANIGTDYAAIVPQSMAIEFVQASISGSIDLFERRANWLDQQISKLVLGQTQTTDATAGGYATASVHDGVREDIERADARQLAATLGRDLVRPVVDLNMGPRPRGRYPRLKIGRPDEVDVDKLVGQIARLVPLGLKVGMSTVRDRLGLPDPAADEELLGAPAAPAADETDDDEADPPAAPGRRPAPQTAFARAAASARAAAPEDAIDRAVEEMLADDGWEPVAPIIAGLQDRLAAATTLEEATAAIADQIARMDVTALAERLARAAFAARLAGETEEPIGGDA